MYLTSLKSTKVEKMLETLLSIKLKGKKFEIIFFETKRYNYMDLKASKTINYQYIYI